MNPAECISESRWTQDYIRFYIPNINIYNNSNNESEVVPGSTDQLRISKVVQLSDFEKKVLGPKKWNFKLLILIDLISQNGHFLNFRLFEVQVVVPELQYSIVFTHSTSMVNLQVNDPNPLAINNWPWLNIATEQCIGSNHQAHQEIYSEEKVGMVTITEW